VEKPTLKFIKSQNLQYGYFARPTCRSTSTNKRS